MSTSASQWFKGCAIGCGGLTAFFVLAIVGMTVSMRSAFDDAHADREILTERFGDHDVYTPAADGRVADDRVAAFVAVREALAEIHVDIEEVDEEMGEFENLTEDGEPELRVALPAVFSLTKSMLGLPFVFGEIERTRNRALVENEMGLGEYTYIFVTAYHRALLEPTTESSLFTASPANSRVREGLRGMIRRQVEEARTELPEEDGFVTALSDELVALETDDSRIPWQDGLPESIASCFTPYRDRLDETYSPAAAEFELLNSTVRGGGLSIQMD